MFSKLKLVVLLSLIFNLVTSASADEQDTTKYDFEIDTTDTTTDNEVKPEDSSAFPSITSHLPEIVAQNDHNELPSQTTNITELLPAASTPSIASDLPAITEQNDDNELPRQTTNITELLPEVSSIFPNITTHLQAIVAQNDETELPSQTTNINVFEDSTPGISADVQAIVEVTSQATNINEDTPAVDLQSTLPAHHDILGDEYSTTDHNVQDIDDPHSTDMPAVIPSKVTVEPTSRQSTDTAVLTSERGRGDKSGFKKPQAAEMSASAIFLLFVCVVILLAVGLAFLMKKKHLGCFSGSATYQTDMPGSWNQEEQQNVISTRMSRIDVGNLPNTDDENSEGSEEKEGGSTNDVVTVSVHSSCHSITITIPDNLSTSETQNISPEEHDSKVKNPEKTAETPEMKEKTVETPETKEIKSSLVDVINENVKKENSTEKELEKNSLTELEKSKQDRISARKSFFDFPAPPSEDELAKLHEDSEISPLLETKIDVSKIEPDQENITNVSDETSPLLEDASKIEPEVNNGQENTTNNAVNNETSPLLEDTSEPKVNNAQENTTKETSEDVKKFCVEVNVDLNCSDEEKKEKLPPITTVL